jgi:hypothetical protein
MLRQFTAADESYLIRPGNWEIKVTAQRSGAYEQNISHRPLCYQCP